MIRGCAFSLSQLAKTPCFQLLNVERPFYIFVTKFPENLSKATLTRERQQTKCRAALRVLGHTEKEGN
jgi:hypothetical protein